MSDDLYYQKWHKVLIYLTQGNNMKPSAALRIHREAVKKAVLARRACNARVFGSTLSGTDTDGSDLDLLVDTLPGTTLFELGGLQVDLEELLGVPVTC